MLVCRFVFIHCLPANYAQILNKLKQLIVNSGRKAHTLVVGKLNPSKLANFMEIDAFVMVACPLNSILESREFLRPIVTPHELVLALTDAEWTMNYQSNFDEINFDSALRYHSLQPSHHTEPYFSLISSKLIQPSHFDIQSAVVSDLQPSTSLELRNPSNSLVLVGNQTRMERSWDGLKICAGENAPMVAETGRSGNSQSYDSVNR